MSKTFGLVGGGSVQLSSIAITAPPAKTAYTAGETFDPAGMVVEVTYSNGTTAIATGYSFTPSAALTDGVTSVTIQYMEGGITKTAEQAITVVHRLTGISIVTQPAKVSYEYGDSFDAAGMAVQAAYSDGATAAVTGYACAPATLTTLGTQEITVSYTENGVTQSAALSVTVERKSLSTVPSQSGSLTYTGSAQSPVWTGYDPNQLTLGGVTSGTDAGSYSAAFTPTANYRWSDGSTGAKTVVWSIAKAAGSLSISPTSLTLDTTTTSQAITVTRSGDGAISAVSSAPEIASVSVSGNTVTVTGLASGSAVITISVAEGTNHTAPAGKTCAVAVSFAMIYGVEWDGTSATTWSRTDAAETFADPSPAVNNGTGSSPFDSILPWSGMVIEEDAAAGTLVKIPKYYYKWTRSGAAMKLQISATAADGFLVSPAHADRGDGAGERDYVYVGRYHCDSSYRSATGVPFLASITRDTARTSIHNLGSVYWQYDFAMFWTIMMLYLVEFANWDSQAVIGFGSSAAGKFNMGATDAMQYHTGTTAATRSDYGSVQYRYIEDLWNGVYDWCDGIYFSAANVYCIKNPASFSDTANGTLVGTRATSSGCITAWTDPTASGFEYALYPNAVGGSTTTYVGDYCQYNAAGVVLYTGGYYGQLSAGNFGAFALYGNKGASDTAASIGCRLVKLP